jgi:hypothetical protein
MSRAPAPESPAALEAAIVRLVAGLRPHGLCDSCLALDARVSGAEAKAVGTRLAETGEIERMVGRCDRCRRTLEVTRARPGS